MAPAATALWREPMPPILASQSEIRRTLLVNAGLAVEPIPAHIDERAIQADSHLKDAGAIASLLAGEKAKHVSALQRGRYVIGADQTLALGKRLFSKPADRAAAAGQLALLAGQMHELHSAVSVVKDGEVLFADLRIARMTMRQLTAREIDIYLDAAGDAVTASVGAYQLEGLGIHLFERIEGDHFTVLGLPLLPLLAFMRSANLLTM